MLMNLMSSSFPMRDDNWSILDIMVMSSKNKFKNGYVQKTQFSPPKEAITDDPTEVITNQANFLQRGGPNILVYTYVTMELEW